MADKPPLLFTRSLHGLMPANDAASEAVRSVELGGVLRVEVKRTTGHMRRMALYWIVLAKAAEALNDKIEGEPLDAEMLHTILKDRRGLYKETVLPSGQVIRNYNSISFTRMPETDRSQFISWAFKLLASWLGCTVDELTTE